MDNLVTSNIRQRPIRTLVSVAGVALGVSLVMLFTGLARGMANELQRRATNVRAELIFMRPGAVQLTSTTANLDTRYVDRLKQIEGVEEALPVIRYFFQGNKGIGLEQIDGVDWDIYARMNGINMVAGHGPQSMDEIVIDEDDVRTVVQSVPEVLGCHQIRTRGSADHAFMDLHVWLDGQTPLESAHATSHVVKDRLMKRFPQLADVVIHIEPPPPTPNAQ